MKTRMTHLDYANSLTGSELVRELEALGVAKFHIDGVMKSNDVTLARALYVYTMLTEER